MNVVGSTGFFLRVAGLEPARFDPLEPKSSVSTNSTIPAYTKSMGVSGLEPLTASL